MNKATLTVLLLSLLVGGFFFFRGEFRTQTVSLERSLFFYHGETDVDESGNIMCSSDAVLPVAREVSDSSIEALLEELFLGVEEGERLQGFSSEYGPNAGVRVLSVEGPDLSGHVSITLEDQNGITTGGSCRVGLLYAQLEKTLLGLEEVSSITIYPEDLFQP